MHTPKEKRQAALEEKFPEAFTDAAGWIDLAQRATKLFTGYAGDSPLWFRDNYETLRVQGKRISTPGRLNIKAALKPIIENLRTAKTPVDVARYTWAIEVLQQAQLSPDKRVPFSRFRRATGLGRR